MATNEFFGAAINNLTAGWIELRLARLFGKRVVGVDEWAGRRTKVTCYRWRGKLYMTDMTSCEPQEDAG